MTLEAARDMYGDTWHCVTETKPLNPEQALDFDRRQLHVAGSLAVR
jgi:hypothetical protein